MLISFITKKTLVSLSIILVCLMVFSACSAGNNPTDSNNTTKSDSNTPAANQKSGDTTKTGKISEISDKYYLQEVGGIPEQIESLSVDLGMYVGQTITVTGQFSGDTLFVGSISVLE